MIVGGFVTPATPVLVPEVGRGRERSAVKTVTALRRAARMLRSLAPDALVVIVAGPEPVPIVGIPATGTLRRGFGSLDVPELERADPIDPALAAALADLTRGSIRSDSGQWPEAALAALYFLAGQTTVPSVCLQLPSGDLSVAADAGHALSAASERRAGRVVAVAVGELSSRLFPGAPDGYSPGAAAFDADVVSALEAGSADRLLALAPRGADAGDSGLAQLVALSTGVPSDASASLLSYEAPFGVGYLVAALVSAGSPA